MGEQKRKKRKIFGTKTSKNSIALLVVVISVASVIGLDLKQRYQTSPLDHYDIKRAKGNSKADLRITEFIDFTCSQCAVGSKLISKYIKDYPESIFLNIKYYPLGALNSMVSAKYAQCAAQQNKFWEFHDKIFEEQSKWQNLLKIHQYFEKTAQEISLDEKELKECVDNPKTEKIVDKDKKLGRSNSVRSTPTYFINGKMHVGAESLRKALLEFVEDQKHESKE